MYSASICIIGCSLQRLIKTDVSPIKSLNGVNPDLSHLNSFGGNSIVGIPMLKRKGGTLCARGEEGHFLGYIVGNAYQNLHSLVVNISDYKGRQIFIRSERVQIPRIQPRFRYFGEVFNPQRKIQII